MATRYALTTVDNPFDPFDQFTQWLSWDQQLGYNCSGYLARITHVLDGASTLDENEAVSQAIDEILEENGAGLYRKVSQDY